MPGRELKQLFRAYREGDELAFRRAAQEIIEDEESKQHMALARDLRRIIAGGSTAAVAEGVALPAPPMDREGEWPLAEIKHPEQTLPELVLSGELLGQLQGLASEFSHGRSWIGITFRVGSAFFFMALLVAERRVLPRPSLQSWDCLCSLSDWTQWSPPTSEKRRPTCIAYLTTPGRARGYSYSTSLMPSGRLVTTLRRR